MEKSSGLYVHIPFCEKKCGYCSFYSVAGRTGEIDAYLSALAVEAAKYRGEKLRTLYVGGGTPSVMSIFQWRELVNIITRNFDTSTLTEATTEANPNSLTPELVKFLRDNNFSRVSLGVQSLIDDELATLGRIHDSRRAVHAMELVKNSGLVLSCDLIFGIPGQTLRTWAHSLKTVMNYANHISAYQLTLEPDTPLAKIYGDTDLNNYEFYRYAQYFLPRHNFPQYEISSFAPENYECRHNMSYWTHDDVIALGASAVSYVDGVRTANPPTLERYFYAARKNFPGELTTQEKLSPRERKIELAILSLRTRYGISRDDLLPEVLDVLSQMPGELFANTPGRVALSRKGMRVGNAIWAEIIGV